MTTNATQAPALELSSGLAMFGQVAGVLILIVAVIFICGWLFRKLALSPQGAHRVAKVVSTTHLGAKERLLVVEIDDKWIVLGVTPQSISKVHEMAPQERPAKPSGSFAERFQTAFKQQLSNSSK
ncbi:Flagellar protein FliO [Pseudidiomarina piscicola]|uniref:Flagellar protein n=1 Tax=Pseudidiomarina piscicola TaxID=2614830 RepID=A0A6S6WRS7_9GAMM|nr:flagellar biosynthetic protein FliO [Pseudidiomarina piscicola]CAB0151045.1 Flagellar protein FliO [Pseudidiomarina piscicola]VZT40556.1 Flagellar protein FliO [Pseudomonas aeruginosa]